MYRMYSLYELVCVCVCVCPLSTVSLHQCHFAEHSVFPPVPFSSKIFAASANPIPRTILHTPPTLHSSAFLPLLPRLVLLLLLNASLGLS